MKHLCFRQGSIGLVMTVAVWAGGCKRECPQSVPARATVAGTTERLEEDGVLYVCPKGGADVATRNVTIYADEQTRVRVYGEGSELYVAAQSEVEVTAPEASVVAHRTASVELQDDTRLERCEVVLKVPESLQAICRGEEPEPTADTGNGTTGGGGGNGGNNGGNGGNGGTTSGGTGGYTYVEGYYTGTTADTATGT